MKIMEKQHRKVMSFRRRMGFCSNLASLIKKFKMKWHAGVQLIQFFINS